MRTPTNFLGPAANTRNREQVIDQLEKTQPSNMTGNHHFLVPEKFKGDRSNAQRWLDQFIRYSENKELTERLKINDIFNLLQESAYDYFDSLSVETKNNWEQLEVAFRAKYCRKKSQWEASQMLLEKKQDPTETLVKYIDRIQNMGLRERLEESLIFSAVMTGICPSLRPIVAHK